MSSFKLLGVKHQTAATHRKPLADQFTALRSPIATNLSRGTNAPCCLVNLWSPRRSRVHSDGHGFQLWELGGQSVWGASYTNASNRPSPNGSRFGGHTDRGQLTWKQSELVGAQRLTSCRRSASSLLPVMPKYNYSRHHGLQTTSHLQRAL